MRRWIIVGGISCVVLLSFFISPGYQPLHKDHSIILPPLHHRLDPSLFPHDDFKYEVLFGKRTIFLDVVEIFARAGIDMLSLLFILTIAFRLIFFISIYYLVKYFSGDVFFSLIALFFTFRGSFSDFLSYELPAVAMGAAFLTLCVYKKNILSIVMLVFSFMMHPITGIALFVWYCFFISFDIELSAMKKILYIFAGIIPVGIFSMMRGGDVNIFSRFDSSTIAIARAVYPNIFISSWPWGAFISFGTWVLLGGLIIWRADEFLKNRRKKFILVTAITVPVVLLMIAFIGGEVLNIRGIAVLQLFRSIFLLKLLLPGVIGYLAYYSFRNNPERVFENALLSGIVVWLIFKENFIFLPEQMLFFIIPLCMLALGFQRGARWALVVGIILAGWRSNYWDDLGSWYFFLGTCGVGMLVAYFVSQKNSFIYRLNPQKIFVGSFLSIVFFLTLLSPVTALSLRPEIWNDQAWMEICYWVQKNTDKADIFLVEPFASTPNVGSFRLTCLREPFLIEGELAGLYDPSIILEWKRRADFQNILQYDIKVLDDIKKKYRINYILSTEMLNLSSRYSLEFSNTEYFLYKVR